MDQLLNEREAAKLLRISVQLLRKWRGNGMGPHHIKLGKCVRYSVADIDGYIISKRSGASDRPADDPEPVDCPVRLEDQPGLETEAVKRKGRIGMRYERNSGRPVQ